jgi:hypothetical protein
MGIFAFAFDRFDGALVPVVLHNPVNIKFRQNEVKIEE